jgi:hypothetical protein
MQTPFGTLGNKMIDLENIDAQTIIGCQEEIANALEHTCRYAGHVYEHYSVAAHSVLVAALIPELADPMITSEARLWALLHDVGEAFIGDIPAPVRKVPRWELRYLQEVEDRIAQAALKAFFPEGTWPGEVAIAAGKQADADAVFLERAIYQMEVFSSHGKPPRIDYEKGDWLRAVQGEAQELAMLVAGVQ